MSSNLESHIVKGVNYLEKTCRPITGFQNDCVGKTRDTLQEKFFPEDVFTSLNAIDLIGDRLSPKVVSKLKKFIDLEESETGAVNFNKYAYVIPDDVEDTALYHYVYLKNGWLQNDKKILDVARLIYLNRRMKDGIIQLYFTPCEDHRRDRLEAGCFTNAMRFLYYVDAADEAKLTEDYIYNWLVSGEYLNGTRYYPSPDTFLMYCSKSVIHNERALKRFQQPLLKELKKRTDEEIAKNKHYVLDITGKILALYNLNVLDSPEFADKAWKMVQILKDMQDPKTGAWPKDALYKLGGSDNWLGGSHVSSIFAIAALKVADKTFRATP